MWQSMRRNMILRIFLFSCCIVFSSSFPKRTTKCLTGYMTDVQNWVDETGRLQQKYVELKNAVDLSTSVNPVPTLHQKMMTFRTTNRLKYLSLARCELNWVPPIFQLRDTQRRPLAKTLEYLSLYGNTFIGISSAGVHYDVLFNATDATEMNLNTVQDTQAASVWSSGFTGITFIALKELDLRSCSIQSLGQNLFSGMPNLTALYLGENEIYYIDATAFIGLNKLVHLDLSRNKATDENRNPKNIFSDTYFTFRCLENLVSLDLSFTKLSQRNLGMFKSLGKNLKVLSICGTNLNSLQNFIFNGTSIEILDVSWNNGILNFHRALGGLEETLTVLFAQDVGLQTMASLENFSALEILQLSYNEISEVKATVAISLPKLKVLDLNNNRINSWFTSTYSLMPELKLLSIMNNNINVISEEMVVDVMEIDYIALSGNFMICNCHAKDLYEIAAKNDRLHNDSLIPTPEGQFNTNGYDYYNLLIDERNQMDYECNENCFQDMEANTGTVRFLDFMITSYVCLKPAETKTVLIAEVSSCGMAARDVNYDQELDGGRMKLMFLLTIPCVLLPAALLFVFRRHVRYFFITMRNSAMLSLINKNDVIDDNTIFNYDVFVSYCNEDRNWVLDHLLPHMEADCSISACLHERDFQVGLSILENIVSCMDRSRSIMLILSQRFLLSQWCQFEMHLAQHRLLETRREDLTLVLLEDIPRRLRPNTLHYLMVTKTYIVWPKSESERPLFWKRLKKSLLSQKAKPVENVSLA